MTNLFVANGISEIRLPIESKPIIGEKQRRISWLREPKPENGEIEVIPW